MVEIIHRGKKNLKKLLAVSLSSLMCDMLKVIGSKLHTRYLYAVIVSTLREGTVICFIMIESNLTRNLLII